MIWRHQKDILKFRNQLTFSADTKFFLAHKKQKKMPSKVANDRLGCTVFSTANQPKTSPSLKFCSLKYLTERLIYNDFVFRSKIEEVFWHSKDISFSQQTSCLCCFFKFTARHLTLFATFCYLKKLQNSVHTYWTENAFANSYVSSLAFSGHFNILF